MLASFDDFDRVARLEPLGDLKGRVAGFVTEHAALSLLSVATVKAGTVAGAGELVLAGKMLAWVGAGAVGTLVVLAPTALYVGYEASSSGGRRGESLPTRPPTAPSTRRASSGPSW